jgi:hypothetical protein
MDVPYHHQIYTDERAYACAAIILKACGIEIDPQDLEVEFKQKHHIKKLNTSAPSCNNIDTLIQFRDYLRDKTSRDVLGMIYSNEKEILTSQKTLLQKYLKLRVSEHDPIMIFACSMDKNEELKAKTYVAIGYFNDGIDLYDPAGMMIRVDSNPNSDEWTLSSERWQWNTFLNLLDGGPIYTLSVSR